MKKLSLSVISVMSFLLCYAQLELISQQLDSLKYLKGDPSEDCNNVTWRIIANKIDAIQPLIDRLDDSTITQATDKCKKTNLTVGDICFVTLRKILPLGMFAITGRQMDVVVDGCQLGVFETIEANRLKFKQQVQAYYDQKKDKLKWREYEIKYLKPCYVQNNILGKYYIE